MFATNTQRLNRGDEAEINSTAEKAVAEIAPQAIAQAEQAALSAKSNSLVSAALNFGMPSDEQSEGISVPEAAALRRSAVRSSLGNAPIPSGVREELVNKAGDFADYSASGNLRKEPVSKQPTLPRAGFAEDFAGQPVSMPIAQGISQPLPMANGISTAISQPISTAMQNQAAQSIIAAQFNSYDGLCFSPHSQAIRENYLEQIGAEQRREGYALAL